MMAEQVKIDWKSFLASADLIESNLRFMGSMPKSLEFKSVLAIGRGGFILGSILSHKLELPLAAIITTRYSVDHKAGEIKVSPIIGSLEFPVLIVDDIVDDGTTLKSVIKAISAEGRYMAVSTVTKITLPNLFAPISVDKGSWVVFPWEK